MTFTDIYVGIPSRNIIRNPTSKSSLFSPAILQLALLQSPLLTLTFPIFPQKIAGITSFLHGVHLQFALNQCHMLKQENTVLHVLKFLSAFLRKLHQLLQANRAVTETFSLKKDQYSQVIAINKRVPTPCAITFP